MNYICQVTQGQQIEAVAAFINASTKGKKRRSSRNRFALGGARGTRALAVHGKGQ